MIIHVALPIPLEKRFSYLVPDKWQPFAKPYSRVIVPFHNRSATGFITGTAGEELKGLKEIHEVVDIFPLLSGSLIKLCEWASPHYVTPLGLVLKYALPSNLHLERYLVISSEPGGASSLDGVPLKKALKSRGKEAIFSLCREGAIGVTDILSGKPFEGFDPLHAWSPQAPGPTNDIFVGPVRDRLAHYTSLITDCLQKGKNTMVLLPDYYLTGDYFYRAFLEEFPGRVLWYGSSLKGKSRMETYFKTRVEGGHLILGNKSCTFLPAADLGLIVVERPEEDHYRNEEGFKFNAALLALKRAELEGIPVVFGTASPSTEMSRYLMEGRFRALRGRSQDTRPHHEVKLEKNMALYDPLPDDLLELIGKSVTNNERIAVFTPRKDYSSYIQCLDCKTLFSCPVCNGIMTYQKEKNSLVCPVCMSEYPYKERCTQCGGSLIRFSRIGAEYLEEHLRSLFPDCPVVKITGETAKKEVARLRKKSENSPLILVGTQTLGSLYGLKTDRLLLVGWEELSRISGYRASEKMFHILHHLLDALDPEEVHFFMERRKRVDPAPFFDVEGFCGSELERREIADFPPYTRLFLVQIEKKMESGGSKTIAKIRNILSEQGYTGPVTGPLYQKRANHQWRIILKGNEESLCRSLLRLYDLPDVRVEADPLYL
jgi:primosomal protein N' (replication factor Y)